MNIAHELSKLNTKVPNLENFKNSLEKIEKSKKTEKNNKKLKKKNFFSETSKTVLKRNFVLSKVEKLVNKCNLLDKDVKTSRVLSEEIGKSHNSIQEFLLNPTKLETKHIDEKFFQNITSYMKFSTNEIVDTSRISRFNRKLWKQNHVQLIANIDNILYK